MCNHSLRERHIARYSKRVLPRLEVPEIELEFSDHAYPKYLGPVIVDEGGRHVFQLQRWGVWPFYEKNKNKVITNARDDGLFTKSVWKQSVMKRRCLIPATGYFEPGVGPPGARGELFFTIKGRQYFHFAGVWDTDPDGSGARGYAMVTTRPNEYTRRFHDRMPVVLSDDDAVMWLGSEPLPHDKVTALCVPLASEVMNHVEVQAVPRKSITKGDLESANGELELF